MATPYEKVYGRFLARTTDFTLAELNDYSLGKMLRSWLGSAIIHTRTVDTAIICDDENECFSNDLSELDIELLGIGMTLAWLDQTLNSTELTLMMLGGKEEKFYSQANHIEQLRALRESTKLEMQKLHSYHTYTNNSYFGN